MATKREQILAQLKTLLLAATQTPAGDNVYRSRARPIPKGAALAINIVPAADPPDHFATGALDWALTVDIQIHARGDEPDRLADPTVISVHSKLVGDFTLGGLAIGIEPGPVSFDFDDADQDVGVTTLSYEIRYRTTETDLTQ